MDKVLKKILLLKNKPEKDWQPALAEINILENVSILYENFDLYTANILLAFTILAFHQESEYKDLKKDRIEDKTNIMTALAGPSALTVFEFRVSVEDSQRSPIKPVIDWLFDYQLDWRMKACETLMTYSANAFKAASLINPTDDPKKIKELGLLLDVAIHNREKADAILKKMSDDFAGLDEIASLEGLMAPTKKIKRDESWESYIAETKNKPQE